MYMHVHACIYNMYLCHWSCDVACIVCAVSLCTFLLTFSSPSPFNSWYIVIVTYTVCIIHTCIYMYMYMYMYMYIVCMFYETVFVYSLHPSPPLPLPPSVPIPPSLSPSPYPSLSSLSLPPSLSPSLSLPPLKPLWARTVLTTIVCWISSVRSVMCSCVPRALSTRNAGIRYSMTAHRFFLVR